MSIQTLQRTRIDDDLKRELLHQYKMTKHLPPLIVGGQLLELNSPNSNQWGISGEDSGYLIDFATKRISEQGIQLRADHSNHVRDVIGNVIELQRFGNEVHFEGAIGDSDLAYKFLRSFLRYVSSQIHSDQVLCSNCHSNVKMGIQNKQDLVKRGMYFSIKQGVQTHLCNNAFNLVKEPQLIEVSLVTLPAYSRAIAVPIGILEE